MTDELQEFGQQVRRQARRALRITYAMSAMVVLCVVYNGYQVLTKGGVFSAVCLAVNVLALVVMAWSIPRLRRYAGKP